MTLNDTFQSDAVDELFCADHYFTAFKLFYYILHPQ